MATKVEIQAKIEKIKKNLNNKNLEPSEKQGLERMLKKAEEEIKRLQEEAKRKEVEVRGL